MRVFPRKGAPPMRGAHPKALSYGAERHNFNFVYMEPLEWIALISGILGLLGVGVDVWQTNKANKRQEEHDEAMAALNHRYREEEAISSFNRELGFNQFEDASKKMVQAGLSPSLMYGGSNMATNVPSVSSVGSSQGAGNVGRHVSVSDFLGKLDPFEYSSH